MKVRVIYDFSGEAENELSVVVGEELTVSCDAGNGWYQVVNQRGLEGLVPSAFTEVLSYPEPAYPPPQLTSTGNTAVQGWDDDFDSDDSTDNSTYFSSGQADTSSQNVPYIQSPGKASTTDAIRHGLLRKHFSRAFLKSGGEDFVLQTSVSSTPNFEAAVVLVGNKYQWHQTGQDLRCTITSFLKEQKLKGIKQFTSYELRSSVSDNPVLRRYKRFHWLYLLLAAKFSCTIIPPLPDKAITGRFDEHFIEERQYGLQRWLNRMCKHPVISKSAVFLHFLTCSDEKKWKNGKRKAEADPFQAGRFYYAIDCSVPANELDFTLEKVEATHRQCLELERSFRTLRNTFTEFNSRFTDRRKECTSLSAAFFACHRACSKVYDQEPPNNRFPSALAYTAETFRNMQTQYAKQSDATMDAIACLRDFTSMFGLLPSTIELAKSAVSAADEAARLSRDEKLSPAEASAIHTAAMKIGRAGQAEYNLVLQQLETECSAALANHLRTQATCLRQVAEQLDLSAAQFNS